jgi:hypothetical protein
MPALLAAASTPASPVTDLAPTRRHLPRLTLRLKHRFDTFLESSGLEADTRAVLYWAFGSVWLHLWIVLPISLLFIVFISVVFRHSIDDLGMIFVGLLCALLGLCMFIEGLRLSMMVHSLSRAVG